MAVAAKCRSGSCTLVPVKSRADFYTTDDGVYVFRLTVSDEYGKSSVDDVTVVVANLAPVVTNVTNDGPAPAGADVKIDASATDPAGNSDPLQYRYDCDGNGAFERVVGVVPSIKTAITT